MSQCECNEKDQKGFSFKQWNIKIYHHSFQDKFYRDKVLMYKEGDNNNKIITIICFNPGTLHSNCGKKLCNRKDSIGGDLTLRYIKEVFENSNYMLEILNVFNVNASNMKKFKEMYQNGEINKIKNNYSIKDYLSPYEEGHLVFIQWGTNNKECTKEKEEIRKSLTELEFDVKSLPKDETPMHPINWRRNRQRNMIPECKHRLKEILRSRNEKAKI